MNHVFHKFEEVEESIKASAPPVIYKYRDNWNNPLHKSIITNQTLWLAAPRTLNDPHDLRVPLEFDVEEIEKPEFYLKLKEMGRMTYAAHNLSETELEKICQERLIQIKSDPVKFFNESYSTLVSGPIYDRLGLFSCTTDELNEKMWAHYGGSYQGFVIGFNTVELARSIQKNIGSVRYENKIHKHSFLNDDPDVDQFFQKSTEWDYEKEFRFFTFDIKNDKDRIQKYQVKDVYEILIGYNFPPDQLDNFIMEVRKLYSEDIPIYKVSAQTGRYGLVKTKIA